MSKKVVCRIGFCNSKLDMYHFIYEIFVPINNENPTIVKSKSFVRPESVEVRTITPLNIKLHQRIT